MRAKKLPSGKWICEGSYTDAEGRRHRKSFTADTRSDAEDMASQYRLRRDALAGGTVGERIYSFIESKRPVLSPSTIRSYISMRIHIDEEYPKFARTAVADVERSMLQAFINDLSASHSPKTVRNYYGLLTSSLPDRLSELRSVTLPQKIRPDYHIPTSDAVQAILEASKGTDLEIPVLLASVCTMRAGEICALTLDDIEGNTIHVSKSVVRGDDYKWHTKAPKTYSSDRFVVAPEWLIKKIRRQGYITKYNPAALSIAFGRLLKRRSLCHCRFHDLRHYSASYMHSQGVPSAYIMSRGGWQTETVLNAVYRHALDDEKKKQTEKINADFSALFGE